MRREPRRSKGSNANRSAQAAALASWLQHRIGRRAEAAAVAATGRSTGYSIGHSCRKQHWPQRTGHTKNRSTGYSTQATLTAAALATPRRLHQRPTHWPQRKGHTTDRCTVRITCRSTNISMSASENCWQFNFTVSAKMQRVVDV